jgi:FixJ family two-component response regulator
MMANSQRVVSSTKSKRRSDGGDSLCVVSVVDDDAAIRDALADLFDSVGYRTCTFENAESFLDSPAAETSRVLITDIQMQGMDGLALLAQVAGFRRHLPVIIITGKPDTELQRRAHESGCAAFLRKPFDSAQLLEQVQATVGCA